MTQFLMADVGGGRSVGFQTWGPREGEPVFLMHGTPGSRLGPRPGAAELSRLGVWLIACDRPGFGVSDRLPGRTVAHVAADTAKVADHLGIGAFSVLGRSGGGPHALACAALLPDRVRSAATLVSLAPRTAEGIDWFDGMSEDNIAEFRAAQGGADVLELHLKPIAEEIRERPFGEGHVDERSLPESDRRIKSDPAIAEMFRQNFAEALRHSSDGWIDDDLSFLQPWGFDVETISAPTRLWHGARDVFSPVGHSRWLAKRIPRATLDIDAEHGHLGSLDVTPELLSWLLSFPG